jgi:rhamnogalacturonyl hydrolase YesR
VTWHLKGEIAEPEQAAIIRKRLSKHISAATNTQATTGLWEAVLQKQKNLWS